MNFRDVYKRVITNRNWILPFGKCKGKTLAYVMDAEPQYLGWCIDNEMIELAPDLLDEFEQMNPWIANETLAFTNPNNGEAWE